MIANRFLITPWNFLCLIFVISALIFSFQENGIVKGELLDWRHVTGLITFKENMEEIKAEEIKGGTTVWAPNIFRIVNVIHCFRRPEARRELLLEPCPLVTMFYDLY